MRKFPLRAWATPITIGAFLLMAGTGVLMFFNLNSGITDVVHQWFSWLFLAAISAHLLLHGHSLSKHLQSGMARLSVAFVSIVFVLSLFSWGGTTGPQLKSPIEKALLNATGNSLADLTHTPREVLVRKMAQIGVATTGQESIADLARDHRVSPHLLLAIVFKP